MCGPQKGCVLVTGCACWSSTLSITSWTTEKRRNIEFGEWLPYPLTQSATGMPNQSIVFCPFISGETCHLHHSWYKGKIRAKWEHKMGESNRDFLGGCFSWIRQHKVKCGIFNRWEVIRRSLHHSNFHSLKFADQIWAENFGNGLYRSLPEIHRSNLSG